MKFPKKREKDYTIKIRIFHHSTKELTMIFTEKRTFPDNNGQMRTIPDKYGHCAWARYYLCIVNETHHRVTQSLTEDKFTIRRAKKKTPWDSVSSVVLKTLTFNL